MPRGGGPRFFMQPKATYLRNVPASAKIRSKCLRWLGPPSPPVPDVSVTDCSVLAADRITLASREAGAWICITDALCSRSGLTDRARLDSVHGAPALSRSLFYGGGCRGRRAFCRPESLSRAGETSPVRSCLYGACFETPCFFFSQRGSRRSRARGRHARGRGRRCTCRPRSSSVSSGSLTCTRFEGCGPKINDSPNE